MTEKLHIELNVSGDPDKDKALAEEVMALIKGGRTGGQINNAEGRGVGHYWHSGGRFDAPQQIEADKLKYQERRDRFILCAMESAARATADADPEYDDIGRDAQRLAREVVSFADAVIFELDKKEGSGERLDTFALRAMSAVLRQKDHPALLDADISMGWLPKTIVRFSRVLLAEADKNQ